MISYDYKLQDNLDVCTYSLKTGIQPVETTVQDIQPTQETGEDTTPAEHDQLKTSTTSPHAKLSISLFCI